MDPAPAPSLQERYAGLVEKPTYWSSLKLTLSYAAVLMVVAAVRQFKGPPPSDGTYFELALMIIAAYAVLCIILTLPVWAWRLYRWRQDVKDAMLDPDWIPRHLR